MTAYATHADIDPYFIDYAISGTSTLTDSQIDAICVTEQAEVDGILEASTGYTVPITGTSSLAIMKKLIALRTAAAVWRRIHVTTQSDQATMADAWRKEADGMLDKILARDIILSDAPLGASATVSNAPRVTSTTEIFPRSDLEDFVSSNGP